MGEEPTDLATRLAATASRRPETAALIWQGQVASYADLDQRVTAAAGGLQRRGVRRGDRVALMLGNSPAFVEAFLAVLRAGAVVVPVNTALSAAEVGYILSDSGARVLVIGDAAATALTSAREAVVGLDHVVVAGAGVPPGATAAWRGLLDARDPYSQVPGAPDDLAALVYTSGTTGRPKGVMLSHRNLDANQRQALATPLAVREGDVVFAALPLFHIYGMNLGLGTAVRVGATLLLVERFDPVRTLELIDRHRATVLLGAPPMYVAWLNVAGSERYDLTSVRVAVSGAAPLPPEVLTRFSDQLGIGIWEGYGLTEAAPAVTSTTMGAGPKPGSVGRPLPGLEVELVDVDGEPVEPGDPGEIWVRGENVFVGYWRDDAATREALTSEGWLRTGDVAVADAQGDLRLVDRKQDLIIVSGFNVYPREVEDVLHRHPGVLKAAVVGIAHPYTGEAVKACVVPAPGSDLTEDDVVGWCRRSLARFKCPQVVEFTASLPATATGKVRRGELRERGATTAR